MYIEKCHVSEFHWCFKICSNLENKIKNKVKKYEKSNLNLVYSFHSIKAVDNSFDIKSCTEKYVFISLIPHFK